MESQIPRKVLISRKYGRWKSVTSSEKHDRIKIKDKYFNFNVSCWNINLLGLFKNIKLFCNLLCFNLMGLNWKKKERFADLFLIKITTLVLGIYLYPVLWVTLRTRMKRRQRTPIFTMIVWIQHNGSQSVMFGSNLQHSLQRKGDCLYSYAFCTVTGWSEVTKIMTFTSSYEWYGWITNRKNITKMKEYIFTVGSR